MAGGGLGFGSGFAQGFAGALTSKRQRERQQADQEAARRDRLFGTLLPTMIENAEDWTDVEAAIVAQYPEMAGGKGRTATPSPLSKLGKVLAPFIGLKSKAPQPDGATTGGGPQAPAGIPRATQPPGVTGGTLDSVMTRARGTQPAVPAGPPTAPFDQPPAETRLPNAIDMPPGQAPFGMQSGDHLTEPRFPSVTRPTGEALATVMPGEQTQTELAGQQPSAAGQPSAGQSFFGVRMMTPEQKAERQAATQIRLELQQQQAHEEARRSLAARLGLSPEQTKAFIAEGKYLAPSAATAPRTATLSPNELLVEADTGKELARGLTPDTATTAKDLDDLLIAAYASGDERKIQAALDLQRRKAEATRAPSASGADDDLEGLTAVARLAAREPAIMQDKTPTERNAIMREIARDPELLLAYETKRQEPARQVARDMLGAIEMLLVIDKTKNEARDLTPGARNMFGGLTWPTMRNLQPGETSANALAALKRLTSQETLNMIGRMKEQSPTGATGFGQLAIKEFDTLASAATLLGGRLGEEAAYKELIKLYDGYSRMLRKSATEIEAEARIARGERPTARSGGGGVAGNGSRMALPAVTLDTPVYIGPDGRPSLTPP